MQHVLTMGIRKCLVFIDFGRSSELLLQFIPFSNRRRDEKFPFSFQPNSTEASLSLFTHPNEKFHSFLPKLFRASWDVNSIYAPLAAVKRCEKFCVNKVIASSVYLLNSRSTDSPRSRLQVSSRRCKYCTFVTELEWNERDTRYDVIIFMSPSNFSWQGILGSLCCLQKVIQNKILS